MAQLLDEKVFVFGEDDNLDITVTDPDGADLSSATATVTLTDSAGTTVLAATGMTGSGTTSRRFTYLLTTGAAQTLTSAAEYLATYVVTYNGRNLYFEQVIRVLASLTLATSWPDEDDIAERLTEGGITVPPRRTLTRIRLAAIARFQEMTHFYPFLSTGVDETRRFSPPESAFLSLKAGLISLTSLTVAVFPGSDGTELTVNEDFWLMPEDAAEKSQPYRWIQFRHWWSGWPRSIVIVGTWGYALTVPDEAWEAVMALSVAQALRLAASLVSGGLSSWMEKNVQEVYTADPYGQQIARYENFARQVAQQYRRYLL